MELKWTNNLDYLEKEIQFESQKKLAAYVLKIAEHSDKEKHHCDMEISNATTLKLKLTTHDADKTVTDKDYQLAKWIDSIMDR